jgi:hypothetical protein
VVSIFARIAQKRRLSRPVRITKELLPKVIRGIVTFFGNEETPHKRALLLVDGTSCRRCFSS